MSAVDDPVEDGISEGGSPTTSCQCSTGSWEARMASAASVAVVEDVEQVVAALIRQGSEASVVEDEESGLCEPLDELGV